MNARFLKHLWSSSLRLAGLAALAALASCGGGGGGGSSAAPLGSAGSSTPWQAGVFPAASTFANKCVNATGTDAETGDRRRSGTRTDENNFLRSWTNDLYLWYAEVPDLDPAAYSNTLDYFAQLKTSAITLSGNAKDRFHFTYPTAQWQALSQSGVSAGYGAQWVIIGTAPNRRVAVAYTEPSSPAQTNGLTRGAEVMSVDGVSIATANTQSQVDVLNAGLFPSAAGGSHQFAVKDRGASSTRTITMTAQNITSDPVQQVSTIATLTGDTVGYMLFNDHIATSEAQLQDAIAQLQTAQVDDLVLDIRYNGGGYLSIASELAYMIAGSAQTSGRTFEQLQFNDKHPSVNPVTGAPITPEPFRSTASIDSAIRGQSLPTLNLSRVFVLTSADTCSASESIINGLRGIGVEVIQIGSKTCGKPYGFYAEDNCGTTYFSIQFRGVNAQNFGDYADGFVPTENPSATDQSQVRGCQVADDFSHDLGDQAEARFAAALQYQSTLTCPPPSANATIGSSKPTLAAIEGHAYKPPMLTNRIMTPPR